MKCTYLGQCCFLIECGTTRIVTDPYLSDSVDKGDLLWRRQYPAPCTLHSLKPDAVLISHAHDDHMDPVTLKRYLADGGNSPVCAPLPICGKLYEYGVKNVEECRAEMPFFVNDVKITPIPCAHTQLHLDGDGGFFELSYCIEYDGKCVFFGGDMSLYDGLSRRLSQADCDLLLLPINGRDEERTRNGIIGNINEREAAALSKELHAPYIPMHHDLYLGNGCSIEAARAAADAAGAKMILLLPEQSYGF